MSYQGQKNLPVNQPAALNNERSKSRAKKEMPEKKVENTVTKRSSGISVDSNENESDSKKKPRVNDSLLLDNFFIKKKEEPIR